MLEHVHIRSRRIVDLNLLRVEIASNLEEFAAYSYFSKFRTGEDSSADYRVVCVDLDRDDIPIHSYASQSDPTFRGKRFRSGYYLVHYFGDPAYLITINRTFYVFGRSLEKTVWPYFVKHILTIFATDHGFLHLKAAAFELPGAGATLLIGRNSGGKTVFLTQACLAGAKFVSNTHTLVKDETAYGIPSAIRIRRDQCFGHLIDQRQLTAHMEPGDYLADPVMLFDGPGVGRSPVRNLVIVDYNPQRSRGLTCISPAATETFMDQFSFAVTTYGLKDDLLAHHGLDFDLYISSLERMRRQLTELVGASRCYRANIDMLDKNARSAALDILAK